MDNTYKMGYIYLVQPCELLGTNRFKIGCSDKIGLDRLLLILTERGIFVCLKWEILLK